MTLLAEKIERMRTRFEKELETNGHLYHAVDIERVRQEQWQVERFLIDDKYLDGDEDGPFQALCRALQWKKTFGIYERTDQSFAKELWELCAVEINGRDYEKRLIQWEALRNQRKFKELDLIARKFLAHNIERVDRMAGRDGFILVLDVGGARVSNIDLDIIRFKLSVIEHYPCGLRQMLIVDLPWLLNSIMSMIFSLMNPKLQQMVIYCKKNDLTKYIDKKYILSTLNGTREKQCFPLNLRPLDQMMSEYELNEKFIDHFYKTFKLKRTIN